MLQTTSIASSALWNDAQYTNCWLAFTGVLLLLRLILVVLHRKLYARPVVVSAFAISKFFLDYLMFEGVERFSKFSDLVNIQTMVSIELLNVIMSNYMIFSIFYADFVLPPKAIIQFTAVNLLSFAFAVTLVIKTDNRICYMALVIALHILGICLYLDKCIGLLKVSMHTSLGKSFIFVSMLFHLVLDHSLRIFFLSNVLLNLLDASILVDRLLFVIQLLSTSLFISVFIFYRLHNSENLGPMFVVPKKPGSRGGGVKGEGVGDADYIFQNAAEELMFPGENELNTISSDMDSDVGLNLERPEVEPAVFVTSESKKSVIPDKILRRTVNKVADSEDGP